MNTIRLTMAQAIVKFLASLEVEIDGRVVPLFGGVFAIGGGLALGREGPTVQMGGAVGAAVAEWLKVTPLRVSGSLTSI